MSLEGKFISKVNKQFVTIIDTLDDTLDDINLIGKSINTELISEKTSSISYDIESIERKLALIKKRLGYTK